MFRTVVEINPYPEKITYESNIMTLGSCFSEHIGKKLQNAFFQTDVNPFGVLFNPVSIRNSINLLLENKNFTENDIFQHGSLWKSFHHSSLFSANTPEECLLKMNLRARKGMENLAKADFLLITLGTAWVFEHIETKEIVSNCHKLPASRFVRRRLSVQEIVGECIALLHKLKILYPNLKIIFTVSPIRHWKDGAHENNLSKSTLLLAVESIQKLFQNVTYFPAYEILLDELRDYRFFATDMLHPSELAIDYIWQRFSETYFSQKTNQLRKRLEQLSDQMAHRPIHPESIEHSYFIYNLQQQKSQLKTEFPFLAERF